MAIIEISTSFIGVSKIEKIWLKTHSAADLAVFIFKSCQFAYKYHIFLILLCEEMFANPKK